MSASALNRSLQIVFRLRAAFLIIVLLLITAVIVSGIQLSYLSRSQNQAIDTSVPALIHSQRLESLLARILLLQESIRTANNTAATDRLRSQIEQLDADIGESLILSTQMQETDALSQVTVQLEHLDKSHSSLLPIRIILNERDASLDIKRERLKQLREQFRALIEPRLIDTETALITSLLSMNNQEIGSESRSTLIADKVDAQNKLTEISFRFLAAVDSAEQLFRQINKLPADDLLAQINLNIRTATQLLASLKQDQFRRDLASLSKILRSVIMSQNGILAELEAKAEYQSQFELAQQEQTDLITTVSNEIDKVVSDARRDIDLSAERFESALFRTVATLLVTGLTIAAIVLFVSYFVVERQINRRISLLTNAVLDIAKGNTDHNVDVDVDGFDEIGMMAESLKVFKRTALKLRESNEELEQFAYAASHDLRSPLRAIENLAQWTLEDAGDKLPADCYQNLEKILERAQRLSTLQTDLLEYSRAGHSESTIEPISIKTLTAELAEILDSSGNFPVVFSGISDVVNTYVTPLRQVMINLINNAIKHHDRSNGTIQVNARYTGARILISVKDDGPGIDSKFQDQIFELFSMLQSQDEVEGSGLGLALVSKLVGRYEGKLSVQSDPTVLRGTEFTFDWPIDVNTFT